MAVYLDEDMVGEDLNVIAYPHLVLCAGVTCLMSTGRLIGAHFTTPHTERALLRELHGRIESAEGDPRKLYVIANFKHHFQLGGGAPLDKARALHFIGDVWTYDTAGVYEDGAFALVKSLGGNAPCQVHAMRDTVARKYYYRGGGDPEPLGIVQYKNGEFIVPDRCQIGTPVPTPSPLQQREFRILRVNP